MLQNPLNHNPMKFLTAKCLAFAVFHCLFAWLMFHEGFCACLNTSFCHVPNALLYPQRVTTEEK